MSPPTISTRRLVFHLAGTLFFILLGFTAISWGYIEHGWTGASMAAIAFVGGMVFFVVVPELIYRLAKGTIWVLRRLSGRRP